jgi:integrase-like protein
MPTRVDYDYDVAKLGSDMGRLASHINELGAPTSRAVNRIIRRAAEPAGVNPAVSAHWLRHAHLSHALGRGATVGEVSDTLGHANVAMTSAYLHASPDRSSGLVAGARERTLPEPRRPEHRPAYQGGRKRIAAAQRKRWAEWRRMRGDPE